jgi:hypothetical protein
MAQTLMTLEGTKTVWVADDAFQVPGTDLKIWKVKVELPDGTRELYSTMSAKIANLNFAGDLEVYENDKGKVYIRQPKQDKPSFAPKKDQKEWQPRDDNAIRAQWAIGQAVNQLGNAAPDEIEAAAIRFYAMVDRVKGSDFNTGSQPSHGLRTQEIKETEPQPAASVLRKNVSHNVKQDEEWESLQRALRADGINVDEIPAIN